MTDEDNLRRRPIEANLAQALCWGGPAWILDDGPPPLAPVDSNARKAKAVTLGRLQSWLYQVGHRRVPKNSPGDRRSHS